MVLTIVFAAQAAIASPIDPARIHVVDGDTIRVDGIKPDYRLVGFNAPDKGSRAKCDAEDAASPAATAKLRQLVIAGSLDLEPVRCSCPIGTETTERCNHGRLCAVLRSNGINVGLLLIKEGLAAPFVCGVTNCPKLPRPWCPHK
jgi:endonuclease YncB( thermonuclease family)